MSVHFAPPLSGITPFAFAAQTVLPLPVPTLDVGRSRTWTRSAPPMIEMPNGFIARGMSPDPLWAIELAQSARHLRDLRPGWDGPGSEGIVEPIIQRAVVLAHEALSGLQRPAAPYLVPAGNGSLQIEWHRAHAELEFCLEPDGSFDIWGRDHRTGAEFEGEGPRALDLFRRWAPWVAEKPAHEDHVPCQAGPAIFELAA